MCARAEIALICSARSGSSEMYRLRLLREAVRVVELLRLGEPDDLGQRLAAAPSGPSRCGAPTTRCHWLRRRARRLRPPSRVRRDVRGRATAGCCPDDDSRAWHAAARSRTSDAVIVRRSRSRTSVRLTTSSNSGATSGRSVLIGAGVAVSTAWMIASAFVPWNGSRPASIS